MPEKEVDLQANIKILGNSLTATIKDVINGISIVITGPVDKFDDAVKNNMSAALDILKNIKP